MERQALASALPKSYGAAALEAASTSRDEREPPLDAWASRSQSYRRLLMVHAVVGVPATTALLVACLCLARYGWHAHGGPEELGIGAAAWLATEGLREPLFDLVVRLPTRVLAPLTAVSWLRWPSAFIGGLAPITLHAVSHEAVRLGAVALSAQAHPPATPVDDAQSFVPFLRSLYIAIGWAAAECAVRAVRLLVHHLPLYREVRRA